MGMVFPAIVWREVFRLLSLAALGQPLPSGSIEVSVGGDRFGVSVLDRDVVVRRDVDPHGRQALTNKLLSLANEKESKRPQLDPGIAALRPEVKREHDELKKAYKAVEAELDREMSEIRMRLDGWPSPEPVVVATIDEARRGFRSFVEPDEPQEPAPKEPRPKK